MFLYGRNQVGSYGKPFRYLSRVIRRTRNTGWNEVMKEKRHEGKDGRERNGRWYGRYRLLRIDGTGDHPYTPPIGPSHPGW